MKPRARMFATIPLLFIGVISSSLAVGGADPRPVVVKPDDLKWEERPSGVRVAVLHGDPEKPGPFTLRLHYPPGFSKAPHYHPGDAYITVLSGGYFRGYGNTFDRSSAVELTPGTFSVNPAGVAHYEWSEREALIEVHAMGPWRSIYVNEHGRTIDSPRD